MTTTDTAAAAAAATIIAAATKYTNACAVFMDGPNMYDEKLHVHPPWGSSETIAIIVICCCGYAAYHRRRAGLATVG